ncbi:hypothetical protein McanMca71_006605 [Microsporum canis]|uniref:Uncharacterized protein n=1 Tax=Arthroderma otae (strain ATCC MYA-4605 / CBS 113480) TaxID=554155 RepID=C5FPV6_ARTOC|nr:conserved hypothetical protein [Microsporum canis CBS 113480]EEQ31711.1 conserved hypothetical protein [Microsporum canis CBS 113480]
MTLYAYVLVYPESSKTPAHWAIFVTATEEGKVGQEFQAIGSPFHGYSLDIKEQFDLSKEFKMHVLVFLGWHSRLAGVAQGIPAPGISSTPLDPFAGPAYILIDFMLNENCQSWARKFITALVDRGAMDSSALERLAAAPSV